MLTGITGSTQRRLQRANFSLSPFRRSVLKVRLMSIASSSGAFPIMGQPVEKVRLDEGFSAEWPIIWNQKGLFTSTNAKFGCDCSAKRASNDKKHY
jgi:hypothetical protein